MLENVSIKRQALIKSFAIKELMSHLLIFAFGTSLLTNHLVISGDPPMVDQTDGGSKSNNALITYL